VTGPRPPDPATLWPTYARHAALYMGGGPSPTFHVTDRFLLATRARPAYCRNAYRYVSLTLAMS
jgi:hypothetical protein